MCALKYSTNGSGEWSRDKADLPVFTPFSPSSGKKGVVRHSFVAGTMIVDCDSRGGCRVSSLHGGGGALVPWVRTSAGNRQVQLAPVAWSEGVQDGWVRFLPSGMAYGARICMAKPDALVDFEFQVFGQHGQESVGFFFALSGNLAAADIESFGASWLLPEAFLEAASEDAKPANLDFFVKENTVIAGGENTLSVDAFMGCADGVAGGRDDRLRVGRRIDASTADAKEVLQGGFGFAKDCSTRFVLDQLKRLGDENNGFRSSQTNVFFELRYPEIWMRDELLWCRSVAEVSAAATREKLDSLASASANSDSFFRDALTQLPSISVLSPVVATELLVAITGKMFGLGNLADASMAAPSFSPATDCSDLEILLLLAWALHMGANGFFVLSERGERAELEGEPDVESVLRFCARRVREDIGMGCGDLIRTGARDWSALSQGTGTSGRGSSTLNTAMFVFAVHAINGMSETSTGDAFFDTETKAFVDALSVAVNENAVQEWFIRGFDDDGLVVGGVDDGRIHMEVQAWALLARCGTASDRQNVAGRLIDLMRSTEPGLPTLSCPLRMDAMRNVSAATWTIPGTGLNGGFSPVVNAWAVWALVCEGRVGEALECWETQSLRRLMAEFDCGLWQQTDAEGALASSFASKFCFKPGQGAEGENDALVMDAGVALWSGAALLRILND